MQLKTKWSPILAATLVVLLHSPTAALSFPGALTGHPRAWCGKSYSSDWVCRQQGDAYSGRSAETLLLLPRLRPYLLSPGAHVATAPGGLARIALRRQGHCIVGGSDSVFSEVLVRGEPGSVLQHIQGESVCSIHSPRAPVETLCDGPSGTCSAEISGRATFFLNLGAPTEAVASLTEHYERHARIVVCSGYVRVSAGDESGRSEAAASVSGNERFVITIDEVRENTEDEVVTPEATVKASAHASSVTLGVVGTIPGRGRCAASFVEQEERSVEP